MAKRWPRTLLLLSAVLTLSLGACVSVANNSAGNGSGSSGEAADFAISMYTGASEVGGEAIDLSDLRGKPVVLNFWAGLCPPCRAEMPHFQEFHQEYKDRVTLIGIDVGQFTGLGNQEDARSLLEALSVTYPTGFTDNGRVMQDYKVLSMPTTVFINSRGEIFRKWAGALNLEKLEEITNEMLEQEAG